MPSIHSSVLMLSDFASALVGSKALRLGGMKWRTPGSETAGGNCMAFIVVEELARLFRDVSCRVVKWCHWRAQDGLTAALAADVLLPLLPYI